MIGYWYRCFLKNLGFFGETAMKKSLLFLVLLITSSVLATMVNRKKTTMIVIHHSGAKNGNVAIFRHYHINDKGWDDVGYHYVITNGSGGSDGKVQDGRPIEKQGAHAKNFGQDRNPYSIGICLVGNNKTTIKQRRSLVSLLANLCQKYKIDLSLKTIQRHHENCPGSNLDLKEIIREVKKEIERQRALHTKVQELFLFLVIWRNIPVIYNIFR